MPYLRQPVACW